MKKQKWLVGLVLMLALTAFAIPAFSAFAQDIQAQESVLDKAEPVSAEELQKQADGEVITDIVKDSYNVQQVDSSLVSSEQQAELQDLGVAVDKTKKVEVVEDVLNYTGETYKKLIADEQHYICLDSNNQVKTIYNADDDMLAETWDADWNTTEAEYIQTGNDVKTMLNLGSDYELVVSQEGSVDYWFLAYRKVLGNGLVNENDGVNVMVARADNSIAFLSTFDLPVNTEEATITEEQALELAQPIIENLNGTVDGTELKYVRPNYYWTEGGPYEPANIVRLAYEVKVNDGAYTIHVDAVTGEVIGGDMEMSAGGAFGDPFLYQAQTQVNLGIDGLRSLGYTVTSKCNNSFSMKSDITNFLNRSDAYAFFFSGHADHDLFGVKAEDGKSMVWTITRNTVSNIGGNWNFVYLSACNSGTATWANAFNINSNSTNRAYMGFSDKVNSTNTAQYNRLFWAQVGGSRLYNGAIYAKNELSNLYLPLYFTGDRNYWGEA